MFVQTTSELVSSPVDLLCLCLFVYCVIMIRIDVGNIVETISCSYGMNVCICTPWALDVLPDVITTEVALLVSKGTEDIFVNLAFEC